MNTTYIIGSCVASVAVLAAAAGMYSFSENVTDTGPPVVAAASTPALVRVPMSDEVTGDDRAVRARKVQVALKNAGCYSGPLNGLWTANTRAAMQAYTDAVNAKLPVDEPDAALLSLVEGSSGIVCKPAEELAMVAGAASPRATDAIAELLAKKRGETPTAEARVTGDPQRGSGTVQAPAQYSVAGDTIIGASGTDAAGVDIGRTRLATASDRAMVSDAPPPGAAAAVAAATATAVTSTAAPPTNYRPLGDPRTREVAARPDAEPIARQDPRPVERSEPDAAREADLQSDQTAEEPPKQVKKSKRRRVVREAQPPKFVRNFMRSVERGFSTFGY